MGEGVGLWIFGDKENMTVGGFWGSVSFFCMVRVRKCFFILILIYFEAGGEGGGGGE